MGKAKEKAIKYLKEYGEWFITRRRGNEDDDKM